MDQFQFDEFEYRIYVDDVINSQGFFVSNDFGSKIPCGIQKVSLQDAAVVRKAEAAARFAIESENANLVFKAILNLNKEPTAGTIYYITMAVADSLEMISPGNDAISCGGDFLCYQAKVWEKIHGGYKVDVFRLAPLHVASQIQKIHHL